MLDAIRAGGDVDVIRAGVAFVLQALIDAELIGVALIREHLPRHGW